VINPAAGAAVMEGVEHVPVNRVTLPAGNDDTFARLHACVDGDSLPQRRANYAHMLRELARANGRLRRVAELADEALRCNDGLFGRHGKPADFRFKKRMDKIERLLDGRLKDFSAIVRMFSAQAFLHMPPSDREWTDDEIEQAGRTYYTAYRNNARQILKLVENAQQRVATADVEDSDHPDFDRMLAQWSTDQVPGRVRVWRHRHPEAATRLPQDIAQRFDAMEQAFQELLDTRETGHAQKVRAETDLGPVRGKLQVLFKERNNGELDNTLRQLEEIDSGEAAQLAALCRGYLAELADDGSGAFAQYSGIIDMVRDELLRGAEERPNPRLEDALRRMVVIAMSQQQHQQALLILQTLAGMAPAFEPQFAELLRLTGDLDAAVNVYTDYLSKAPGDHVAMLRLGKLYQTIGATDAAKTAFNYVLEKDPDNKAARSLLEQTGTAA
jgi:tetratricopeptide (TPR) repeat protein